MLGSDVLGRVTNLVTSDLANIGGGRLFLLRLVGGPLGFALGTLFLYKILDWRYVTHYALYLTLNCSGGSALVGLAVMLVLLPVPAWGAMVIGNVQKEVS